ncbi:MAG: peptidase M28, partial [Pedobacter sp.]
MMLVGHHYAQQSGITKNVRSVLQQIDTLTIRKDITYLADDKLLGRLPGTPGYKMAVDYVVERFKEIGLTPAGDSGTFIQTLLIRKATVDNKSVIAVLQDKTGNTDTLVP